MTDITNLVPLLLRQLGEAWALIYSPEEIRLDLTKLQLLRAINDVAPQIDWAKCSNFADFYQEVMLRDIQEPIPHGNDPPRES